MNEDRPFSSAHTVCAQRTLQVYLHTFPKKKMFLKSTSVKELHTHTQQRNLFVSSQESVPLMAPDSYVMMCVCVCVWGGGGKGSVPH